MTIACICSTKNEGDIIEAFVRLNGRICDAFFFIDDSSDNTREIISLLVREGYDLNYLPKAEGGYNQPNPTKAYISTVNRKVDSDWIFLLDADEIIVATDKEKLLQEMRDIPPNTYLAAKWKTFVPITLGYFDSTSPLSECFRLRKDKGEVYEKVSIPGALADNIITTPGNHTAKSLSGTAISAQAAESYYLAHFPVRSAEQIVVKNLLATHNLTTRVDAEKGEGFHVFPIFHLIRNRNYNLTLDDLASIAINYGCHDQSPKSCISDELEPEPQDKLAFQTKLSYLNLGRISVVGRLDSEIERLSMEIKKMSADSGGGSTQISGNKKGFFDQWLSRIHSIGK